MAISIGFIAQKSLKSVSNDSFYEKQSMPPQRKYPISLETEKRPIKNMFKNEFLKENFKNSPHWPYVHIAPTYDMVFHGKIFVQTRAC